MMKHLSRYHEYDDDAVDENGVVRDGKSVRVHLALMDSASRVAITDAQMRDGVNRCFGANSAALMDSNRLAETYRRMVRDGLAGPVADKAKARYEAARDDMIHTNGEAWKS